MNCRHTPRKPETGFTLIELVIVVSILALLTGILIPVVRNELERSMVSKAQTDMKAVADAFNRYYLHTSRWPSNANQTMAQFKSTNLSEDLAGYACIYDDTYGMKGWDGPYLSDGVRVGSGWQIAAAGSGSNPADGLVDPWGNLYKLYVFKTNGPMGKYGGIALLCAGPDGVFDSSTNNVAQGNPKNDDLVQVVTNSL